MAVSNYVSSTSDGLQSQGYLRTSDHDYEHMKYRLREIWAELLKDDASMFSDDDIFFEVGGDSILAQRLISAACTRGISLSMEQIFMNPSLSEMAEVAIKLGRSSEASSLLPHEAFSKDLFPKDIIDSIARSCDVAEEAIENIYPCSPMQVALLAEFDGGKNQYVRQFVFKLSNDISLDRFRKAWDMTIQANAVLRTRICDLGPSHGFLQAVLREEGAWNILHVDIDRFLDWDATNHMPLGSAFFRYNVIIDEDKVGKNQKHFVWTAHHALCDGVSVPELLQEVSRYFVSETATTREPFESFIRYTSVRSEPPPGLKFWNRALSSINPTPYPPLPQDPGFNPTPKSTFEQLLILSENPSFGVTRAMLLRAAWAILLTHYTGTDDVGFGAINDGRSLAVPGITQMTGPTITLVPIALHVDSEELLSSFLSRVRIQAAEMIPFEHVGIPKIRQFMSGEESTALDFQTLFIVHPRRLSEAVEHSTRPLGIEYVDGLGMKEEHRMPLVLTFTLSTGKEIMLTVQHDERVVPAQQARNIAHHLQNVLLQMSKATAVTKINDISPIGEDDISQISLWNKFTPPVEQASIYSLFNKQVMKQPSAIAVCSSEQSLTYADVDLYSTTLALRLISLGVVVGTYVGVCFDKSIWTVVASMAVFKAGGIYVPIDPAHPRSRIEEVFRTVGIETCLASAAGSKAVESLYLNIIIVDSPPKPPCQIMELEVNIQPSSIAYLLFTSGSTGKPKGILMPHSAICTSIIHHGAAFGAGPHWRTLQFCAHTFDLSICEFFTTLAYGGCVCVPSEHDRLNNLAGAITSLNVNTLVVVPTVANLLFPEDVPTLKSLIIGGEPITKETVARWANSVDLNCSYGPSETAVWSSSNLRVSAAAHPANIGKSIGTTMWIVNPNDYHQLTAIGCVGEIVLSGALLGGGYFGDKATTDAAFVPAPAWLKAMSPKNSSYDMLYKSGDLARYNPDGTFQIVGRRDTQVKLRGFRIELGEIENQIMATGKVKAALAALPKAGPCARQLVAVVCSTRSDLNNHGHSDIKLAKNDKTVLEDLKAHLWAKLPEYMVPTVWIYLEKMPLLISGKIDRRSINTWIQGMDSKTYTSFVEGFDTNEETPVVMGSLADQLRQLWSLALNIPATNIGLRSSFIALGGDSIAAIQIVSRAKKVGLSLTVRDLVSTKSLARLEYLVGQNGRSPTANQNVRSIERARGPIDIHPVYQKLIEQRLQKEPSVRVEDIYPLAPFQREIMRARKSNPAIFLMSWEMEVFSLSSAAISLEQLAQAWGRVVQQFPILRSIFLDDPTGDAEPIQIVLSTDAKPAIAISSAGAEEMEPSFSMTGTPSVDDCFLPHRAHFTQHGERYYIHIELDHLVLDGWSFRIIKEALLAAYEGGDAYQPEEAAPYKAFINELTPDRVTASDNHWAAALQGQRPSILALPVTELDRTFAVIKSAKTVIYLPELEARSMRSFSVEYGITPASIWDAAWAQTLSAYTRSSDVSFEYVVSGRDGDASKVFDIVGPLINVLAYHLKDVTTKGGPEDFAHLALRMQEQRAEDSLHTSSNVREVIGNRLGGGKLFNTALNFQRRPTAVQTERTKIDEDLRKSKDPWHFEVLVRVLYITDDDTFRPSLEFDAQVFDTKMMNEVAQSFFDRVKSISM